MRLDAVKSTAQAMASAMVMARTLGLALATIDSAVWTARFVATASVPTGMPPVIPRRSLSHVTVMGGGLVCGVLFLFVVEDVEQMSAVLGLTLVNVLGDGFVTAAVVSALCEIVLLGRLEILISVLLTETLMLSTERESLWPW